ncbi:hypothetical protein [Nitrospirillum bahiense]|uniref:hypothetical protein n=1 Tax=Nitrospirillum amazonense TaxID=28077 RepID=UPI0011A5F36B|nr:hypothetical protein [Nitrospirillum amazonense]
MADGFTEIKIKELDDEASAPSGVGSLMRIVLRLSSHAPIEWENYFNAAWEQHFYMSKRQAYVAGDRLEIICALSNLESEHIPELKKVIDDTNRTYQNYKIEQDRIAEAEEHKRSLERQELSDLKGRLKFD